MSGANTNSALIKNVNALQSIVDNSDGLIYFPMKTWDVKADGGDNLNGCAVKGTLQLAHEENNSGSGGSGEFTKFEVNNVFQSVNTQGCQTGDCPQLINCDPNYLGGKTLTIVQGQKFGVCNGIDTTYGGVNYDQNGLTLVNNGSCPGGYVNMGCVATGGETQMEDVYHLRCINNSQIGLSSQCPSIYLQDGTVVSPISSKYVQYSSDGQQDNVVTDGSLASTAFSLFCGYKIDDMTKNDNLGEFLQDVETYLTNSSNGYRNILKSDAAQQFLTPKERIDMCVRQTKTKCPNGMDSCSYAVSRDDAVARYCSEIPYWTDIANYPGTIPYFNNALQTYCNTTSPNADINDCQCVNAKFDNIYTEISNSIPNAPQYCWYLPCKQESTDQLKPTTDFLNLQNCPSYCQQIQNFILNNSDLNIGKIIDISNCSFGGPTSTPSDNGTKSPSNGGSTNNSIRTAIIIGSVILILILVIVILIVVFRKK